MGAVSHWHVRISRGASRWILDRDEMFCAICDWNRWSIRHGLNVAFWDRGHCASMADWEGRQAGLALSLSDLGLVDRLRGRGL